jgi:hypothetical protein
MASESRQRMLLGALGVVLALVVAYSFWPASPAVQQTASSNQSGRGARSAQNQPTAPDVHIESLSADRPKPDESDRDLFKFKQKAAPPAPSRPTERPGASVQQAPRPTGPPAVPPITLKFIGYIEAAGGTKIASLSDGKSVWTAPEGATLLGQYKIWRVGVESIDISYLDGRGRQTIRMTGQ